MIRKKKSFETRKSNMHFKHLKKDHEKFNLTSLRS